MWPGNKIPFTYHDSIEEVPRWKNMVDRAIRMTEEESCLEFEDISNFMNDYMKNYTDKNLPNYFHLRAPPPEYPDYLL